MILNWLPNTCYPLHRSSDLRKLNVSWPSRTIIVFVHAHPSQNIGFKYYTYVRAQVRSSELLGASISRACFLQGICQHPRLYSCLRLRQYFPKFAVTRWPDQACFAGMCKFLPTSTSLRKTAIWFPREAWLHESWLQIRRARGFNFSPYVCPSLRLPVLAALWRLGMCMRACMYVSLHVCIFVCMYLCILILRRVLHRFLDRTP